MNLKAFKRIKKFKESFLNLNLIIFMIKGNLLVEIKIIKKKNMKKLNKDI